MRKNKIFGIYGCFGVSSFTKGGKSVDTIEFLDTRVCLNNPRWQSSGIIFLCCYMVISDTLGRSFLDVVFLLLAVMLSELSEKPRRNKDSVTEKST